MAIKSTVFKVQLSVADVVRHYYEDHALTLARHPSETDTRMLLRVVAFALNAHERLTFTKGLSDVDEPDLWQLGLTGDIEHWIELGQPLEKRLRQSCGKAARVTVYTYQRGGTWYEDVKSVAERFAHLRVVKLALADEAGVAAMIDRSMTLNCLIEDDRILLSDAERSLTVDFSVLKPGR
jgi:uncharacterized protein YaeQ